jgi:hypothetical protein
MANNCYNSLIIEANTETLDELQKLFETYDHDQYGYLYQWANTFFEKFKETVTLPNTDIEYNYYGTKWWEFHIERTSASLSITGDSAWSPPIMFINMLVEHYKLNGEFYFSEPGNDFGGVRIFENGEITEERDTSYLEHIYNYQGIDAIIDEYVECNAEDYDNYKDFLKMLDISHFITAEDNKSLKQAFYSYKTLNNEQEILDMVNEVQKHLQVLGMTKFADKLADVSDFLSIKWENELNTVENGESTEV